MPRFNKPLTGHIRLSQFLQLLQVSSNLARSCSSIFSCTTPWTAGIGPLSTIRARACRCASLSLGGLPVSLPSIRPPGMSELYTPEGEAIRQEVNSWIRSSNSFDAATDFEAALADPAHPTRMLPEYDCGDHPHPAVNTAAFHGFHALAIDHAG